MSGLRGSLYATRTTTKTKNLIGIVFSLVVVRSICALLTSTQAPASKVQDDANPPGKIVLEDFEVVSNTAPVPKVSPTSGATSGGTFVSLTRTGLPAGETTGGTSATNVIAASLSTRSFEEKYRGL